MSTVEVVLTVGKLDASLALLTTQDHHVIEFPTMLLPDNVRAGSIITMNVRENVPEEQRQRKTFEEIQQIILEKYGSKRPQAPVLNIVNTTQTSCVLSWDQLSLGSAKLKQLILYRQGVRSAVIPNPFKVTSTKISGLSVDTPYEFQLKLVTTSGQFWSQKVKVRTHKMTDMSGITVCLGPLDPLLNINERQIKDCLKIVGARHLQKHVAIDTTHFICNDLDNEEDEELIKAKNSNIPIVRPEWIRACAIEKRIVGVRGFYLDADKGILKSYPFPSASTDPESDSSEDEFGAEEAATPEATETPEIIVEDTHDGESAALEESAAENEATLEEPNDEEPTFMEQAAEETPIEEPATEESITEETPMEETSIEEPVSEEPVAETIANEEPVSEEPVAETIANEEPVSEEPVAETIANEEPVSEEPVAETIANEEPVSEEPVAETIANEEPVSEEPVAETIANEEPVAEEPVAEEPVTEEPVAEEPVTEEPVAEEPTAEEQVAEEPVTEEPVTEEPVTEEPVTEEPTAEEPTAEEPTVEPITTEEEREDKETETETESEDVNTNESTSNSNGNDNKSKNNKKKNKKKKNKRR
ncbi:chitin biosynthesis protein Chs5p [Monosporozyma servazzii]